MVKIVESTRQAGINSIIHRKEKAYHRQACETTLPRLLISR